MLGAFACAFLMLHLDASQAVTIGFLTFGFARLWHVFNMRGADSPLLVNEITGNRYVWIAVAVGVALLLVAAYFPPLAQVLSAQAPTAKGWALILVFSVLPLVIGQLMKLRGVGWEAKRG